MINQWNTIEMNRLLSMYVSDQRNNIRKEPVMLSIPSAAYSIFMSFSMAFTKPTFQRVLPLAVGALLTRGRHTITNILWTMRGLVPGHSSSYHRVFSRATWSLWPLGRALATAIVSQIPPQDPILVPMDDTTAQHRGKCVYGKGCHHDAVRSARKQVVFRWGHRWIVLAVAMKFPFTSRQWALPVLVALYRPEALDVEEGRPHKTAIHLARQLMAVLIHWFPERQFVFLGDGGYASHELARFCHRHKRHATLVSRFHGNARLYTLPPKRNRQLGRPRIKGRKLPTPEEVVARKAKTRATVHWYGGQDRRVHWVSDRGQWYKGGSGLVPIRWVFVHDCQGTHRDDYFYTTDATLRGPQIISWFTARWPIETTFQEVRAHLGFETPRQHVSKSVLRMAPCLLGMFSVTCLIFAEYTRRHHIHIDQVQWYTKTEPTFSDAITTVRRLFWQKTIFAQGSFHKSFQKLTPKFRNTLLDYLCRAA
jgi:hypothetical protein